MLTRFEPLVQPHKTGLKTTRFEPVLATRIEPVQTTRIELFRKKWLYSFIFNELKKMQIYCIMYVVIQ